MNRRRWSERRSCEIWTELCCREKSDRYGRRGLERRDEMHDRANRTSRPQLGQLGSRV